MDNRPIAAGTRPYRNRFHAAMTVGCPVAGLVVQMLAPEATGTMVTLMRPDTICVGGYLTAAMSAPEPLRRMVASRSCPRPLALIASIAFAPVSFSARFVVRMRMIEIADSILLTTSA